MVEPLTFEQYKQFRDKIVGIVTYTEKSKTMKQTKTERIAELTEATQRHEETIRGLRSQIQTKDIALAAKDNTIKLRECDLRATTDIIDSLNAKVTKIDDEAKKLTSMVKRLTEALYLGVC